jgi:intraflagellar transport protein 88
MRAPKGTVSAGGNGSNTGFSKQLSSVRGAGYSSKPAGSTNTALATQRFDPLAPTSTANAPPLAKKTQESPEELARELEEQVNQLLEQTVELLQANKPADALGKAKECMKRERALVAHREKRGLTDQINTDLTFAVGFNLAQVQQACGMPADAMHTYSLLLQDQHHALAGRVRLNMGALSFAGKDYKSALKHWRMCADQLAAEEGHGQLAYRVNRNISVAQLKLGLLVDAIETLEALADDEAHRDPQVVFNLLVCHYAVGDVYQMKRVFELLLKLCDTPGAQELLSPVPASPFAGLNDQTPALSAAQRDHMVKYDELFRLQRDRQRRLHEYVHTAARLIAPSVGATLDEGYEWVIEALRECAAPSGSEEFGSAVAAAGAGAYAQLALEMEMAKGLAFLRSKDIAGAYAAFQHLEQRDEGLLDHAAVNLAFLYFLEGDYVRAEAKADVAVRVDRYNARALVNKGVVLYVRGELEAAREVFLEAVGVEADCTEAIFNLGLCNKRMGHLEDALQAFRKLHRLLPHDVQTIFQLAKLCDALGRGADAAQWLKALLGLVGQDAGALAMLGSLACRYETEAHAVAHFTDSFQAWGVQLEVISWLGVWHVKQQQYHEAVKYFNRAAEIAPDDLKWKLMVAACYRRMGDVRTALQLYTRIHALDGRSVECLRYLVAMSEEARDPKADEYRVKLAAAERAAALEMEAGGAHPDDMVTLGPEHGYGAPAPQHEGYGDGYGEYGPDGQGHAHSLRRMDPDDDDDDSVGVDEEIEDAFYSGTTKLSPDQAAALRAREEEMEQERRQSVPAPASARGPARDEFLGGDAEVGEAAPAQTLPSGGNTDWGDDLDDDLLPM